MLVEDDPRELPVKRIPFSNRSERPQYRLITWHLNEDFYPNYIEDSSGKVQITSWQKLLEYIIKAGFCYAPVQPWHLDCLLKILPGDSAVELARRGSLSLWCAEEGPYNLSFRETRTSAKLRVQVGKRQGSIGCIDWLLPAPEEKFYGAVVQLPDGIDMNKTLRIMQKALSLCRDIGLYSPDLSWAGSLIGDAMMGAAPHMFDKGQYDVQQEFSGLATGGDANTIKFGGDGKGVGGWDKVAAVSSKLALVPGNVKLVRSKVIPESAIHGVVPARININTDLTRSPIQIRKKVWRSDRYVDVVGTIMKRASLDDIRVLQEHPEWGKYELLDEGLWIVPVGGGRAFEEIEEVLFDYRYDPDLRRMAKALGFASYGVFGKKLTALTLGEHPSSLPGLRQHASDFLSNPTMRDEWTRYYNRIPRLDTRRATSNNAVWSSFVNCKINREIRELSIMTNANSVLWDCIRDGGDIPEELKGSEMGQYKPEGGEGFFINDVLRGSFYRDIALSQKPDTTKLIVPTDLRVRLKMVDNKRYHLRDVGRLVRNVELEYTPGSSKRLDNPVNIGELLEGKKTRTFNADKDSLDKLGFRESMEYRV